VTPFTGTTNNTGNHDHGLINGAELVAANTGGHDLNPGGGGNPEGTRRFYHGGAHEHTVTITGGGDNETAPVNYTCNFFIRVNN
jgi:hypothetical protein